jgi:hypothetical protein
MVVGLGGDFNAFGPSTSTNGYVASSFVGGLTITTSTGTTQLKGTTSAGTVNCYSSLRIFKIA